MEERNGFITTIGEEDDVVLASESSDSDGDATVLKVKVKKQKKRAHSDFASDFVFTEKSPTDDLWKSSYLQHHAATSKTSSLDEKIAKIRQERKSELLNQSGTILTSVAVNGDEGEITNKDKNSVLAPLESDDADSDLDITPDKLKPKQKKGRHKNDMNINSLPFSIQDDSDDKGEIEGDVSYAPLHDYTCSFHEMNLSRPLMKALTAINFVQPTPIQAATVPIALLGKDVYACAATGTGKTAAFMLPILERLLYKPKQSPVTRVLVLVPTRELAVQVFQVSRQLAQFTNVNICLAAGGLDIKSQEAALRLGPDIVIATPGRLIDHIQNTPSFSLSSIEILVLDEADRMLDEYFAEQMKEIITQCSMTRQTMLFSATMTTQVEDLAAVSLKKPVKIFVDSNKDVAFGLRQEFVRIRANKEGDREAIVAALVSRTFPDHCLVFVQTKKQAHRLHIVFGLLGINVGELHGNLSQPQRLDALRRFKEAQIDVLAATDLAARGLDIEGVKTVINFTMPNTVQHYIHRVGRTARAGKAGRSVSLVGESERKMLKELVKRARQPVKSRVVPQEVISKYRNKINSLEKDIGLILKMEREEKDLNISEARVHKAEKLIKHHEEILSHPKRTWFQTHQERMTEQEKLRLGQFNIGATKLKKKEAAKLTKVVSSEDRVELELRKTAEYQARLAKRARKQKRILVCPDDEDAPTKKKGKQAKNQNGGSSKSKNVNKKTGFSQDLTNVSKQAVSKLRAGPSYKERKEMGLFKKKTSRGKFKSKSRYKRK